eukprot:Seg4008.2 transcript_id=Seg4008.2/GoldUCD/mRNA.D3Y31 product="putative transporter SVOPL" protein_id=Seg4008.2/GoldUCD/D3Y31
MEYITLNQDPIDTIIDDIGFGRFHIVALLGLGLRSFTRGTAYSLLAILEPYFQCEFGLTLFIASLFVTSYMVVRTVSSGLLGLLADKYGRRNIMILSYIMSAFLAVLQTLSNSYACIAIIQASKGLFQNAQFLVYPYLLEIIPKSKRKYLSFLEILFVSGFLFCILISKICLEYLSWQWIVVFSELIPILLCAAAVSCMPQSPRYLLAQGDKDGAAHALARIAVLNKHGGLSYDTVVQEYKQIIDDSIDSTLDGSIIENEPPPSMTFENWKRVIMVSVIRLVVQVCRSALTFGSTQVYGKKTAPAATCGDCAASIQYGNALSVSTGIIVSFALAYNFIGQIPRRLSLQVLISGIFVCAVPFYFKLSSLVQYAVFFTSTTIADSLFIVMFVYSSEVVPTSIRGTAVGIEAAAGNLGQLIGSIIVFSAMHLEFTVCLIVMHALVGICLLTIFLFAVETKDTSLK